MQLNHGHRTWLRRCALVLVAMVTVVVPAAADGAAASSDPPPDVPAWVVASKRAIIGVGNDTTETLFERLGALYNEHHDDTPLGSWRATGPSPITPKAGCDPITRPNGSSPGIAALANRQVLPNGRPCLDFTRSLSPRTPGAPANSVYLPFALDAITYAHNETSNVPPALTIDQLRAIIECRATQWDQVGGNSAETIQPFLPEVGPGLLALLHHMGGITQIGPCVRTVQQDQGTDPSLVGNPNALVFYAVGKYIGQTVYGHSDEHGDLVLGNVNGIPPTVFDPATRRIEINAGQVPGSPGMPQSFLITEWVVVLRDAQDTIPRPLSRLFVGAHSWLCSNPAARRAIADYGFLPVASTTCGQPS